MLSNDLLYNLVSVGFVIDTGVVQQRFNQGKASVTFAPLRCGNVFIHSENSIFLSGDRFHTFQLMR